MKKFLCSMFAVLVFASSVATVGCGGEKEYKEPEGVEDLEIDGAPPMPGE